MPKQAVPGRVGAAPVAVSVSQGVAERLDELAKRSGASRPSIVALALDVLCGKLYGAESEERAPEAKP